MSAHPEQLQPTELLLLPEFLETGQPSAVKRRYLDVWLAPLLPVLERPNVTDIYVNRPGECWVETLGGGIERIDLPDLDAARLWQLARQIASLSHQGISREHPLLSATLPDGGRVQIVAPPATRGDMAIAIRKYVVDGMDLGDYLTSGAFNQATLTHGINSACSSPMPEDESPAGLARWLGELVRSRANIIISGGTSSGKTTFLNALLREIPDEERLIVIEDTPELQLPLDNAIGLVAVKGSLGEARVTTDDLLQAALRMRPDRIIVGELRGVEAYAWLRAVNTGHPGSITTIHADSPEGALEQLALIVLQSGTQLRREDILHYTTQVIDVIVQLERVNGERRITRVLRTRP
jgi:type IV secretion system protein VirB11